MPLPKPVLTSHAQCAENHCVDLRQGRSICKCVSKSEDAPSHLVLFNGDKEIQRWRAEAYVRRTDDFEVLSGDLRGDGKTLWIVANHEMSTQGILLRFWSLHVLDPADPTKPPISWTVSDYGPGSFALPHSPSEKGCDLLLTEWVDGIDAKGKSGLYFSGSWFRMGDKDLKAQPMRKHRLRPYLRSFERERAERRRQEGDRLEHLKGNPARWLRPDKLVREGSGLIAPNRKGQNQQN